MKTFCRSILFALLPMVISMFSLCVTANAAFMNTDFQNTTGNMANDYHLKLVSNAPITVFDTYEHGGNANVTFNAPKINGNGSNSVTLDWSGATVNNKDITHVGFAAYGMAEVAESYWTVGGLELHPRIGFLTAVFSGATTDFLVERILLFSDLSGTELIGTIWWEDQAMAVTNYNFSGVVAFASVSTARFSTEIPLEDLNESLTGFGSESAIQQYTPSAVPEPASLLLMASSLAGLFGFTFMRYQVRPSA
jgi:hypothetical protein